MCEAQVPEAALRPAVGQGSCQSPGLESPFPHPAAQLSFQMQEELDDLKARGYEMPGGLAALFSRADLNAPSSLMHPRPEKDASAQNQNVQKPATAYDVA